MITSLATVTSDAEQGLLAVTYEPKAPDTLMGRPLSLLANMHTLVIESLPVLRTSGLRLNGPETSVRITLDINGTRVLDHHTTLPDTPATTAHVPLGDAFTGISTAYDASLPPE